jgi:hypothetical protein
VSPEVIHINKPISSGKCECRLACNVSGLKGQRHDIFDFWLFKFFHESVSPKPLSIPGDIRSSRYTTGVVDTGGKWEKSSIIKVVIILFGHLWEVELCNL